MEKGQQERADWVLELLDNDDEDCTLLTTILPVQPHLNERSKPDGSRPGRAVNKRRDPHDRTARLIAQYFADQQVYDAADFRRRFRMSKELVIKIHDAVVSYDDFFVAKPDATGKPGIPGVLKVTAALRVLAYASSAEVIAFASGGGRSAATREQCKAGFGGMLGSVDCMHIEWKNCPSSLAGQYKGKEKKPTVVQEAWVDSRLWIWHRHFGSPGSLNGINILDQ
ncbi:hypothetical protein ON010_g6149 [Phytophthora cinnamomi]|nr:hypothetical protein ON010_g6149 [Phytophthora cinnamomi]